MPIPYEILIRGNADGTLRGAHAIDDPGGNARPITVADLADLVPDLNAAALAAKDEAADLVARIAGIKEALEGADTAAILEAVAAKVVEAETPKRAREIAEIDKQIAELSTRKAELEGKQAVKGDAKG